MITYYDKLPEEKFAKIYTDEKFRNDVAYGYLCTDESQIAEAEKELARAKEETFEKYKNDLLFAGMGCKYKARYKDDICNYRIRTEFLNRTGKRYFIEFESHAKGDGFRIAYAIDRDMEITLEHDFNRQSEYNNFRGLESTKFELRYTKTNILSLVNEYFGCNFRNIIIDQQNIHPDDREIICESPE